MIPITRRELASAFRSLVRAAEHENRTNSHRLLLFYAVECGLKAIFLKRNGRELIEAGVASELGGHDLNKAMSMLRYGGIYALPTDLRLKNTSCGKVRNLNCSKLNEVWRYGAALDGVTKDNDVELKLEDLVLKIKEEI